MSPAQPTDRLNELADRYWRFWCHESPLTAVLAGETTSDAVLFRESLEDHERRNRTAGELLTELEGIAADEFTTKDRATLRLLRRDLESIRNLCAVQAHHRPSLYPTGPPMMVSYFANSTSVEDAETAERFVDRLATVPSYLSDLRECLQAGHDQGFRYPRLALECASGAVRDTIAGSFETLPWSGPFKRSPAASAVIRRHGERVLTLIRDELVPAFDAFAGFLEGPLSEGARSTVACTDAPLGQEFYRTVVRDLTTTAMSPEEIHELGLAEVARLETDLEGLAADAGFDNDLAGYRAFLAGGEFIAPSKDALCEQLQVLCKRIDGRIPIFFGRIPRMTYGVESMPEAVAERMPPAYAQPNPADRSAPGTFWLTSLPDRCPASMHLPTALHEAWPGHLMHIALMQEADDLPAFRRHGAIRYPACVEGWAIYCEGLGVDMGLYGTPHQHYGRVEMEMWRALRLVVDTGIHWHGWTRERAVVAMAKHLAMPRATIEAEVDRYICWPGQALVYQIGNLEYRRLRQCAEAKLGDRFSYRSFHDALLAAGAVSLEVLGDIIDEWLGRECARFEAGEACHAHA